MAASLIPMEGGSPIALDKPIVLIGRHQECDVALDASSKVSRRHCCIVQVGERYVLRDLGSMNGIRINGHRIVETELCPGDEIAVADVYFTFRRDEPARVAKPGRAVRAADARPPVRESERETPPPGGVVPAPEEVVGYEPPGIDDPSDCDVRAKDDSHSNEQGFVRV